MCGRFTLYHSAADLIAEYQAEFVFDESLTKRYNVSPTQGILTLPAGTERQFQQWQWGMVPVWAKDTKRKPMINIRADTLAQKPYFKGALSHRRCIVPASGFYEWKEADNPKEGGKTPIFFRPEDAGLLSFAGLWDKSRSDDGPTTCAIITTEPNHLLSLVHNRMPVILPNEALDQWLDPSVTDPEELLSLLVPAQDSALEGFPVGRGVNSPAHDDPECVTPVGPPLVVP